MLKTLANVDEIKEQHKADGFNLNRKFEVKTKKENKEKDKLINPKQIFEKTPKNMKKKGNFRFSHVDDKKGTKKLPITEENY